MFSVYTDVKEGPLEGIELRVDVHYYDVCPADSSVGIYQASCEFHPDYMDVVLELGKQEFKPWRFNNYPDNMADFLFDFIDTHQEELEEAAAEEATHDESAYWDMVATERQERLRGM